MVVGRVASLVLLFNIVFTSIEGHCTKNGETCVMKHLKYIMETEDVDVRPSFYQNDTISVKFGIALNSIDGLDLIGNNDYKLTVSCTFRHLWNDHRLTWNPTDFDDVFVIRIPIQYIWRPDLVLFNNYNLHQQIDMSAMAFVSCDGSVLWCPPAKMTVRTQKDAISYPWTDDTYSAAFKFGSWTYDGFKLDVDFYDELESLDITDYVTSSTFDITENSAVKNVKTYPCCLEPYPDLTFSLTLTAV